MKRTVDWELVRKLAASEMKLADAAHRLGVNDYTAVYLVKMIEQENDEVRDAYSSGRISEAQAFEVLRGQTVETKDELLRMAKKGASRRELARRRALADQGTREAPVVRVDRTVAEVESLYNGTVALCQAAILLLQGEMGPDDRRRADSYVRALMLKSRMLGALLGIKVEQPKETSADKVAVEVVQWLAGKLSSGAVGPFLDQKEIDA